MLIVFVLKLNADAAATLFLGNLAVHPLNYYVKETLMQLIRYMFDFIYGQTKIENEA